ncbi:MAG: hypothetical protein QXF56_02715 [Candidatus Micrarchaeia archaeon]
MGSGVKIREEMVIDGVRLSIQPHWLVEGERILVGREIDEHGNQKEVQVSVKLNERVKLDMKVVGREGKLWGLREDVLMKLSAEFDKTGELIKIGKFQGVKEYANYDGKKIESEVKKVLETEVGKQWLEGELKNLDNRKVVVRPL